METEVIKTGEDYRLILYKNMVESIGYKVNRKDLYDLYTKLREIFKDS
jgi:hypothetical protein